MPPLRLPGGCQRVVLVALAILPLLVVVLTWVPALIVQPFLPGGADRVLRLATRLASWVRAILTATGPDDGRRP